MTEKVRNFGPGRFDAWADQYLADVENTDQADEYPFAGYRRVLEALLAAALARKPGSVLDLGIGLGLLSQRLAQAGHRITGVDFSAEMLSLARQNLPHARLVRADFAEGWPAELKDERFDLIVSSYAFHHVPQARKVAFLQRLLQGLEPAGMILIGDIAFQSEKLMQACRQASLPDWDEEEDYPIFESLKPFFREGQMSFKAVSFCAGILSLTHA